MNSEQRNIYSEMKEDEVFKLIEELNFSNKRLEVLESDLFKSQTKIKKQDIEIKKLQEMITINNKNNNNTSIAFFLPSEFKSNWETFLKDMIMEALDNIYNHQSWLSHIVQDTFRIIYEETNNLIKSKLCKVLQILNINEKSYTIEKFLYRFRSFFQENFTFIFTFTDELYTEIQHKIQKSVDDYQNFDLTDELKQDMESKSFKTLVNMIFRLSIYMILHDPILVPKINFYNERELEYFYYAKNDFINIEGFGKEQTPCIVILHPPVFNKNRYPYQGIKPAVCSVSSVDEKVLQICEKNKVIKETIKSNLVDECSSNQSVDNYKKPNKSEDKEECKIESNVYVQLDINIINIDSKCYNQPLSKVKKTKEDNLIVTINLSNNNNLVTCTDFNSEKKIKNANMQKKNYRSNSEVVKKEEILNSSEVLDCNNSFLSNNNEDKGLDNKDLPIALQKNKRINDGLKIYRKEDKNKNYPLKVKQSLDKKDSHKNLQQQYSSNKQKFMSHDFLRKKEEITGKMEFNDQSLLRKKLVSPDLAKTNNTNFTKLESSNNTNNILKKLGFNSPKLNSYFKIINESVKKNSIKTVFADFMKKQKGDNKQSQQKNLNSSNPSKGNPISSSTNKIINNNNNRNTAALKCGLSKNLTDQNTNVFIDFSNTEFKYNGPKKEGKKHILKEETMFDNFKSNKKVIHISPKHCTLKESDLRTKEPPETNVRKEKNRLFDHSNTSKPVAFKNLQKSLKNKV